MLTNEVRSSFGTQPAPQPGRRGDLAEVPPQVVRLMRRAYGSGEHQAVLSPQPPAAERSSTGRRSCSCSASTAICGIRIVRRDRFVFNSNHQRGMDTASDLQELCGAEGIRTPDPLHAMEVRYQLRYSPARPWYWRTAPPT